MLTSSDLRSREICFFDSDRFSSQEEIPSQSKPKVENSKFKNKVKASLHFSSHGSNDRTINAEPGQMSELKENTSKFLN